MAEHSEHSGRVMATHPMEHVHASVGSGKHPVETIRGRKRSEHEAPHHRPHEHGSHPVERGEAGMEE